MGRRKREVLMLAREYGMPEPAQVILAHLRPRKRGLMLKELSALTKNKFSLPTLIDYLKWLEYDCHLVARVEDPKDRRKTVYVYHQPFPRFEAVLEGMKHRIAKADTPEALLEALEAGLYATVECLVEASREFPKLEKAQAASIMWSAFLWNELFPGRHGLLALLAKVLKEVRPEDVTRVLGKRFPELATAWGALASTT
jgi:hypothetical protein